MLADVIFSPYFFHLSFVSFFSAIGDYSPCDIETSSSGL